MGRRNRSIFGLMLVGASAVALYLWRNRRVRDYARSLLVPASDCVRDFIKKTLRPQVEVETDDGKLIVTGLSPPEARPLSNVSQILSWDPYATANPDQPFCRTYNAPLLLPSYTPPRPPLVLAPAATPGVAEASAAAVPTEGAVTAAGGGAPYGGGARPRLLVCHDMMGGYLADRLVQGAADAGAFRLWHWDCMDVFVYFSHHMVSLPPPGWIAAAHRNGVRVLGTFITEGPIGRTRCEALFSSPAAARRTADTLAALAAHYGFEGWLVNVENSLAHPQVECLRHGVAHLRARMEAAVGPAAMVVWYDAVTTEGHLSWQDGLTPLNAPFFDAADALFVNYRWREGAPAAVAAAAGSRVADVFMGVDVFGRGSYGGGKDNCPVALSAARSAGLSAALFAPGWVYEEFERSGFERRQEAFWGAIRAVWTPRPAQLVTLPLTSTFNTGAGKAVWLEGRTVSAAPWHNLAAQDMVAATTANTTANSSIALSSPLLLPPLPPAVPTPSTNRRSTNPGFPSTYGPLTVRTTQQVAYCGGSCLALTATAIEASASGGGSGGGSVAGGGPWLHQLYSAHLAVPAAGLDLSYTMACAGSSRVAVVLRTAPGEVGATRVGGWCGVAVGPWSGADRPVVEALRRAGYICIACPAAPTGATTCPLPDSLAAPSTSTAATLSTAAAADTAPPAAGLPWVTCAAHLPAKMFMQSTAAVTTTVSTAGAAAAAAGPAAVVEPAIILGVGILCYHSPVALGTAVGGGVGGGVVQPAGSSSASGKGSSARVSTSGFTAAATGTAAAMAAAVSAALEGADGAVSYSAYLGKLVLHEHRDPAPGLLEPAALPLATVAPAANTMTSATSMQPLLVTATAPPPPSVATPLAAGRCNRIRWGHPLTAGNSSRVRSLGTSFNSLSAPGFLNAAVAAVAAVAAATDPRASDELLDSDEDWDHHSCAPGAAAAAATGGSPVKILSADVASDELDLVGGVGEDSLEVVGCRGLGGSGGEEGEAAEMSRLLTCELSWEPQFDVCGMPRHRSYHVWALFGYGSEPAPPPSAAAAAAAPSALILAPDVQVADGEWSSAVWAGEAHVAAFRLVQLEVPPAATSVSLAVQPLDWVTADLQRLQPMVRLAVPPGV